MVTSPRKSTAVNNVLVDPSLLIGNIVEVMPNQIYFACLNADIGEHISGKTAYVSFHGKFHYEPFYQDFGPWNLSVLYRLCSFIDDLVYESSRRGRKIVLYCVDKGYNNQYEIERVRVNCAYVLASYLIIHQNVTADAAYLVLSAAQPPKYVGFRDAAMGAPSYLLHLHDVLRGVEKAMQLGWLDFSDFNCEEYELYEKVENGDFNWIIPGKILSFCGPHNESRVEDGYPYHAPDVYFDYFQSHGISTIVRLNLKLYDAKKFTRAGFDHVDLFFVDGSTPSDEIVENFIRLVDTARGGVAVHCKAGLGRTGTLIACWMMKEFGLTAAECMAWLRVCRPGSVIGPQQKFLIEKQKFCWSLSKNNGVHISKKSRDASSEKKNVRKLVSKVDGMCLRSDTQSSGMPINGNILPNGTQSLGRHSRENARPRPNILPLRSKDRRPTAVTFEQNSNFVDETALDEHGRSQGDRLLANKVRSQHATLEERRPRRSVSPTNTNGIKNDVLSVPSQAFLNKNREPITPTRKLRSNNGQVAYRTRAVGSAATSAANSRTPTSAVFPSIASRRSDATRFSSPTTPIKPMSPMMAGHSTTPSGRYHHRATIGQEIFTPPPSSQHYFDLVYVPTSSASSRTTPSAATIRQGFVHKTFSPNQAPPTNPSAQPFRRSQSQYRPVRSNNQNIPIPNYQNHSATASAIYQPPSIGFYSRRSLRPLAPHNQPVQTHF